MKCKDDWFVNNSDAKSCLLERINDTCFASSYNVLNVHLKYDLGCYNYSL